MHQIRVHARHIGHPVIGDDKYGEREINKAFRQVGVRRLFLHASGLVLPRQDGKPLELSAPLPQDLGDVLVRLRIREEEHGEQYRQE